jgi:hypothetical protein
MPSKTHPDLTFKVDGSAYDFVSGRAWFSSATLFSRDGRTGLSWLVGGGARLDEGADPFLGKSIELWIDTGDGTKREFFGRCDARSRSWSAKGWAYSYEAVGLKALGDRVPHTDHTTGSDTTIYNADPTDTWNYSAGKAGRSLGQILMDVLSFPENAAALAAYGIGAYVTTQGYGADGTVLLGSGGVSGALVTSQGSGYDPDHPPNGYFFGGGGPGGSGDVAVDADGHVTGFTPTSGLSGYTSPPTLWISPLPVQTLQDLAAQTVIPPFPVSVSGEKLLAAVEGVLHQVNPLVCLHVDHASAELRFLDLRQFGSGSGGYGDTVTLNLESDDRVDPAGFQVHESVQECFSRVVVRGAPYTRLMRLETVPANGSQASLEEDFGHNGLTSDQAKAKWTPRDFTSPGFNSQQAVVVATVNGDGSVSVALQSGGYGYGTTPTVSVKGDGTGAAFTATVTSGSVTAVTRVSGGSGYTTATATITAPDGGNGDAGAVTACTDTTHLVIQSNDSSKSWGADYWDWSPGGHEGVLFATVDGQGGFSTNFSSRITSNTSLSPGGTCTLTIEQPLPSTDFDTYVITGTTGGPSVVWRKYRPTDPEVAARLAHQFSYPVNIVNSEGTAVSRSNFPFLVVEYGEKAPFRSMPFTVEVNSEGGYLLAERPVVVLSGDGTSIQEYPHNVIVYAAVYDDVLAVKSPPDSGGVAQYSGTSKDTYGLEETLTVTVPSWRDPAGGSAMQGYADTLLDSVKDAHVEGQMAVLQCDPRLWVPGTRVNLAAEGGAYTTGLEAAALPVSEVTLEFPPDEDGHKYAVKAKFSNVRLPFSASEYDRPERTGLQIGYPTDDGGGGHDVFDARVPPGSGGGF